jgi:hypothetical protein
MSKVFSKGMKVKLFLVTPLRNMGSEGINPFILNLDIRLRLMVNSMAWPFYPRVRNSQI